MDLCHNASQSVDPAIEAWVSMEVKSRKIQGLLHFCNGCLWEGQNWVPSNSIMITNWGAQNCESSKVTSLMRSQASEWQKTLELLCASKDTKVAPDLMVFFSWKLHMIQKMYNHEVGVWWYVIWNIWEEPCNNYFILSRERTPLYFWMYDTTHLVASCLSFLHQCSCSW